jgi:hypothetical protein
MLHKHAEHFVYLETTTHTPRCSCWLTVAHVIAGSAHITEHLTAAVSLQVEELRAQRNALAVTKAALTAQVREPQA